MKDVGANISGCKVQEPTIEAVKALIAAERADAVSGMHAKACSCCVGGGKPARIETASDFCTCFDYESDRYHDEPITDPRCIAARKEVTDAR